MELPFTHRPGRRERHMLRRHENPLFAWPAVPVQPEVLLEAQRSDHDEMEAFRDSFRGLLQRAVDLPADAGSDVVLGLKEALETHYEQSFGLPEDQTEPRQAIARLISVIMRTIWRQAGSDPVAQQELSDEETARAVHFRLLEQPLVADLLHPESPIRPEELVPSLLSATEAEVGAAAEVFDGDQLAIIVQDAEALLSARAAAELDLSGARGRLALLRLRLEQYDPDDRAD
jgi:hypothetical protein